MKWSAPSAIIFCTLCVQRTGAVNWAIKFFLIVSGQVSATVLTFWYTGQTGTLNVVVSMAAWSSVLAGSINGEWNAPPTFNFKALHYTQEDLANVPYDRALKARPETFVAIDYKQEGMGSASCGPVLAEAYRFKEKQFNYAFIIKPVFTEELDILREARTLPQI